MPIYVTNVNIRISKNNFHLNFLGVFSDDDCGDQSDELSCHHNTTVTCTNQPNHCDQICQNLPNGRGILCSCHPGFRYNKESAKCEDIDECQNATLNYCSHVCINTKGGFQCECGLGFEPSAVNRSDCHPRGNISYIQKFINLIRLCRSNI